jgi:hypothetical protein
MNPAGGAFFTEGDNRVSAQGLPRLLPAG